MNEYEQYVLMIKQIHDSIEKTANNELRADGLTIMQIAILIELSNASGKKLTMKQLEKIFSVAQPTIAGLVSRLEQKNLIETHGVPEDRRVKAVSITNKGIDCCEEAKKHMLETNQRLLSGFSAEEQKLFWEFLKRAADNVG